MLSAPLAESCDSISCLHVLNDHIISSAVAAPALPSRCLQSSQHEFHSITVSLRQKENHLSAPQRLSRALSRLYFWGEMLHHSLTCLEHPVFCASKYRRSCGCVLPLLLSSWIRTRFLEAYIKPLDLTTSPVATQARSSGRAARRKR